MKLKQINGDTYSSKFFPGYKFRAGFKVVLENMETEHRFDIYTTCSSKSTVEKTILDRISSKRNIDMMLSDIVGWHSREWDNFTSMIVDEIDEML